MSTIGGKLIGVGTYSCIFEPKLLCKGESVSRRSDNPSRPVSHKRMISKIMIHEEAETEWKISEKIRNIPMWRNYFSVSETMCTPSSTQKDKDILKCLQSKAIAYIAPQQLRILQQPYSGKTIHQYHVTPDFDLIHFMIHLLESASLLLVHNIVHFDLHSENVLLDNDHIPRIIDFNLSLFMDEHVTESQLSYKFSTNVHLSQSPPDYNAVIGINQHKSMETIVNSIKNKPIIKQISSIHHISQDNIISDITKLIRSNSYIKRGDILGWLHQNWTKLDSWAIGTCFIEFFIMHVMTPHIKVQIKNNYEKFTKVIRKLCTIDPNARWDCMQALEYLHPTSIIIKKYGQKWFSRAV